MTAPIVWHESREPRLTANLEFAIRLDGDLCARQLGRLAPPTSGQLWDRLAERDVQAHGEPRPLRVPTWRAAAYPAEARRVVRANIENRRPAMRATRAGSQE